MPIKQSIDFSYQILQGMEYAYKKVNIIHRDLKPENILLTSSGFRVTLKITDFGLIKTIDESYQTDLISANLKVEKSASISSGTIAGTPPYMSPEQFFYPKDVDTRSDIYSFGVIFYEMVTGELPFTASTIEGYGIKHLRESPADPRLRNKEVSPKISSIILKCLEKKQKDRYQTFSDIIADIKPEFDNFGCIYEKEETRYFSNVNEITFDGFLWINIGQYNRAMESFSYALDLDEKYPLAWAGKGVCSYHFNKLEEAFYFFDKALLLDPKNGIIKKIVDSLNAMI